VYPAATLDNGDAELSVRPQRSAAPTTIARSEWSFARVDKGRVVADPTCLYVKAGLEPGWLYDLVYTARDPRVSGLGFASVRDAVSFFRYAANTEGPAANPLAGAIRHACGFGISQSGRFLQDLIYQDFNGDEQGRTVFDGCFVHVGAAGRTTLNERFAQITRHGSQHEDNLYPTDAFPFTTVPQEDPLTHLRAADAAVTAGRPREAIHALYLYVITALASRELIRYDPSFTDRELLAATVAIPHADALRDLVAIYERSWFGLREPSGDEARRARELALRVAP
jgi:hypothetical protein